LAATVLFSIKNNAWCVNAFRFGTAGDTSWSFSGKSFLCDLKEDTSQAKPALALNSTDSPAMLMVTDPVLRVLQFSISDVTIRKSLPPGPYQYDLIMVDDVTGQRDTIMTGVITVVQGVTLTGV
jgi:hypothetical protein